jgi:hypothetical protein
LGSKLTGGDMPGSAERDGGSAMAESAEVRKVLADVKRLAVRYYQLTGKPLGVTGEVAEYVAAEKLGLTLAPARTKDYDATRGDECIQIKGRACTWPMTPGQRLGQIKATSECHSVLLVLLDVTTLEPVEMWEAPMVSVKARLAIPGKSRQRGALGVAEFKRLAGAARVWPSDADA